MPHARPHKRKKAPKRVLALPDLEHAKSAVLSSLTSESGQRTDDHAIREFVAWYCSEPRLAFNRTDVLRYRIHLEQRQYAPTTVNLRLAAVRRVARGGGCGSPVSPGPRIGPDDGAIPAMQTEDPVRRKQSARHRTGCRRVTSVRQGRTADPVRPWRRLASNRNCAQPQQHCISRKGTPDGIAQSSRT